MPEESKKQQKGKNEPKEQRKSRRSGHKPAQTDSKVEKKVEVKTDSKAAAPQKPEYENPGPEFYSNLKRETEEIIKITEEENAKYKKKEIQSNWSKYEVPIESYDEIEEQENMGADYEKLIAAPLSAGGHFQFKHEKSWDMTVGPSLYDKYFDIDMDNLSIAVCTIPFYERNQIDQSIFTETDIQTMNNRAIRFKQKYFNDKSFTTPDLEVQEKTLKNFMDTLRNTDEKEINDDDIETKNDDQVIDNIIFDNLDDIEKPTDTKVQIFEETVMHTRNQGKTDLQDNLIESSDTNTVQGVETIANPINETVNQDLVTDVKTVNSDKVPEKIAHKLCDFDDLLLEKEIKTTPSNSENDKATESIPAINLQVAANTEAPKKPIIESPEDLEKWLDDFLDG